MTVGIIAVPHPETITLCVHEIWQSVIATNQKLSEILMYFCPFISSVVLYSQFVILFYLMDLVNVNLIHVTEEKENTWQNFLH